MTSPACIGTNCGRLVNRKKTKRTPLLGNRIIDGVEWYWFCSRSCAGRANGERSTGKAAEFARGFREARRKAEREMRCAMWAEEIEALCRYGAPRHLVVAIFERVRASGDKTGYQRAFNRCRKAEAA